MTELYPSARPKIGLALSGAVMRGAAHIGALMALERANIPIDFVAGASAGSLVGGMFCAGYSAAAMVEISTTMHWRNFARPVLSSKGFLSFAPLEAWFVNLIGDINFEDLSRPFAVSATNLSLGEASIFRQGKLSNKVHASCAVPTFAVPVEIDGHFFCDGGVSNNLPVAALREMGADYVIGVDLFVPTIRRRLGAFGFGLAAIETMVRRSGGGIVGGLRGFTARIGRGELSSHGKKAKRHAYRVGSASDVGKNSGDSIGIGISLTRRTKEG